MAVVNELGMYIIKFICMLIFAGAGIGVGMFIRKKKNEKAAVEAGAEEKTE